MNCAVALLRTFGGLKTAPDSTTPLSGSELPPGPYRMYVECPDKAVKSCPEDVQVSFRQKRFTFVAPAILHRAASDRACFLISAA